MTMEGKSVGFGRTGCIDNWDFSGASCKIFEISLLHFLAV